MNRPEDGVSARPRNTLTEAPPSDWVSAVTGRRPVALVDESALLERARNAEARAERAEERTAKAECRVEALERALESRAGLDQAKGILMALFGLDADAAFNTLVWVSQHANVRVTSIAERFLDRACTIDLTERPHERLTGLLSELTADRSRRHCESDEPDPGPPRVA